MSRAVHYQLHCRQLNLKSCKKERFSQLVENKPRVNRRCGCRPFGLVRLRSPQAAQDRPLRCSSIAYRAELLPFFLLIHRMQWIKLKIIILIKLHPVRYCFTRFLMYLLPHEVFKYPSLLIASC